MKALIFITLLLGFSLLMGCSLLFPPKDEEFSFNRIDYNGNALRLDGFYYQIWKDGNDMKFSNVTFFYKNGILLDIGGGGLLSEIDSYVRRNIDFKYAAYRSFWGVFYIEKNVIRWGRYYVGQTGIKVFEYEGEIVSDSIFIMKKYAQVKGGTKQKENDIENKYFFKKFSPKPDSTNVYIK